MVKIQRRNALGKAGEMQFDHETGRASSVGKLQLKAGQSLWKMDQELDSGS
jgi:hypothetical protein